VDAAYDSLISKASRDIARAVLANEKDLCKRALTVDKLVMDLVRCIGGAACSEVVGGLATEAVEAAKSRGLTPQTRKRIKVTTIFGVIEVASPHLRNKATKESARPVKDALGFHGGMRTPAVERALVDFGAEESFALAAQRFEEHYGHEVGRTSVLRVVESVAEEAEIYVEDRLAKARKRYDEPIAERAGVDLMLVELDGSMLRTGKLRRDAQDGGEVTAVRGLPKGSRDERWREVRIGFARAIGSTERTYVARMASYEAVIGQLFSAAVDQGMSGCSEVYAVSDGGQGLREELDAQFSGLTFILDRPHLKAHLFDTAAAFGLHDCAKKQWVDDALVLIDEGCVKEFIAALRGRTGDGDERAARLAAYLDRFSDALDYAGAYDKGVPIGSGEVESAHRYIPQKRMKLPGACWDPDTINPMLALRALRANGWWSDFWDRRQAA